ncbi:MAG: hypothetical protein SGI73_03775 [Chloroflexota bacterium]|nr:hypothetical protein [Chloroflexota bacterium]
MKPLSPSHWDDLLSDLTDAVLTDNADIASIRAHYSVPSGEVDDLVVVMRQMRRALRRVDPSRRYVYRLRRQLLGAPVNQYNVIARVRHLPPRVQIAAALALLAGAMWMARRRAPLPDGLADALSEA